MGDALQTVERSEYARLERDRQRYFANALVNAIRGRDENAVTLPVVKGDIEEPEQSKKDGKAKFRVLGAHRGSKWSKASYMALVLSPEYADAQGNSYQITFTEEAFEQIRARLELKAWACGAEHFYPSARARHPKRTYACEFCELLAGRADPYREKNGEQQRNSEYITREQALIADLLLDASVVRVIYPSNN